ncbi:hypothetical protein [Salinigranum halophilum]|uniref:hypothetical protein n=1 Tax=Salinigranum halophilum TaxID=2565931 RepID=UPI0010A8932E|nr:hypothetical protein [Salinigranum halophilum]
MTPDTTFSPRSHDTDHGRASSLSAAARVEDEYVFTVVSEPTAEVAPTNRSVRVDPSDGAADELVLRLTRRVGDETGRRSPRGDAATVTVPAPGLESPPKVRSLEAVLERWVRRHWDADALDGDGERVPGQFPAGDEGTTTRPTSDDDR